MLTDQFSSPERLAAKNSLKWQANKRQKQRQEKREKQKKKAEKKQHNYKKQLDFIKEKRRNSGRLSCDKCFRDFVKQNEFQKHISDPTLCQPSKRSTRPTRTKKGKATFGKTIKDTVASVVSDAKFISKAVIVGSKNTVSAPVNELKLFTGEEALYRLVTGQEWAATPQLFQAGFARKWSIRGAFRYSQPQKDFLNWAYQYGERYPKNKFTAVNAANLMKIIGTEAAVLKFPNEEYFQRTHQASGGKPLFKWADFVSRYVIKAYFGRLQQLKKKQNATEAQKKQTNKNA